MHDITNVFHRIIFPIQVSIIIGMVKVHYKTQNKDIKVLAFINSAVSVFLYLHKRI